MKTLTYKEAKQRKPLLKWYNINKVLLSDNKAEILKKMKATSKTEAVQEVLELKLKDFQLIRAINNEGKKIYFNENNGLIRFTEGEPYATFGNYFIKAEVQQ